MTHTAEDYFNKYKSSTVYTFTDLAELAARLGSIVTHDRRGNVVWMDDFNDGINRWEAATSGAASSAFHSLTRFHSRGGSCKLTSGTKSTSYAKISRYLQLPMLKRLGYEFSFHLDSQTDELEFSSRYYDGTHRYTAGIKYDDANDDLYYEHAKGLWTKFDASVSLYGSTNLFHTLKLVVDYETKKYDRLIIGSETWDLSGYSMEYYAAPASPYLQLMIVNYSRNNETDIVYIDDVIITQNES